MAARIRSLDDFLAPLKGVKRVRGGQYVALPLRQIYYRLVASGLIANTHSNYNQLPSQLVTARENGDIDESRIVDRSRRIEEVSFDSPESFIEAIRNGFPAKSC